MSSAARGGPSPPDLGPALDRLAERWEWHWPGVAIEAMRADVERRVRDAVERWRLCSPGVMTGGEIALVLGADAEPGEVVVKLTPRGTPDAQELRREGPALRAWESTGAVPALHDSADAGFTLLLERIRPGDTLDAAALGTGERLEALGRLTRRLHEAPLAAGVFTPVESYTAPWAEHLRGRPELDRLRDLLATSPRRAGLHADLHGANVLRSASGWVAIDPHAVEGDPSLDCWPLIDPLAPALPDRGARPEMIRRVELFAVAAGIDPRRAAGWAGVRARAEATDLDAEPAASADERAWARRLHRFADALA